jgi:hypothetical protein
MDTLQTHFDINIGNFRPSKNVWYRSNRFVDVTGKATLTKAENTRLTSILSQAGSVFRTIPAGLLNQIASSETYKVHIMTFMNQKVRMGEHMGAGHTAQLIKWVGDKYQKQIDDAKMPATKAKRKAERDMVLRWYRQNASELKKIFQLQNLLIDAKMLLIGKFNAVNDLGTFLHTSDGGYKVTTPEGYVAACQVG